MSSAAGSAFDGVMVADTASLRKACGAFFTPADLSDSH